MILIGFAEPDRAIALDIATECARLGLPHRLDPRDDWLSQALSEPGDASHAIVVVSAQNAGSWWLPFWVGRADARAVALAAYVTLPDYEPPPFLDGLARVDDRASLAVWLQAACRRPE